MRKKTFDQVTEEMNLIRLGAFVKFCKDFNMPLKLKQQVQVFNKSFEGTKPEQLKVSG